MLIGTGAKHAKDEVREFIEAVKSLQLSHYLQKEFYLMHIHIILVI